MGVAEGGEGTALGNAAILQDVDEVERRGQGVRP